MQVARAAGTALQLAEFGGRVAGNPLVSAAARVGGKLARLGVNKLSKALNRKKHSRGKAGALVPQESVVAAPVAVSTRTWQGMPSITNGVNGRQIIIEHKEFLRDVTHSTAYAVNSLDLNPGLRSVFTWLALQCPEYQKYTWLHFSIEYIARCNTSTEGTMYLAYEYDPRDAPPPGENDLTTLPGCTSFTPWTTEMIIPMDMSFVQSPRTKFIRSGNRGGDATTYDAAKIMYAVSGADAAHDGKVIGKLFTRYKVSLSVPQLESVTTWGSTFGTVLDSTVIAGTAPNAYTKLPFDDLPTDNKVEVNPLRLQFDTINRRILLANGRYFVTAKITLGFAAPGVNNAGIVYINSPSQYRLTANSSLFSEETGHVWTVYVTADMYVKDDDYLEVEIYNNNISTANILVQEQRSALYIQAIG